MPRLSRGRPRRIVFRADVSWPPFGGGSGDPGPATVEEEFALSRPQPTVPRDELEQAARRVVGVYDCRVLSAEGEALPRQVRVTAQAGRRLAVAKDIQTAWFTLWNLYVPRTRFVITAVRSPSDLLGYDRGPRLHRLHFESGPNAFVRVEVEFEGRLHVGEACAHGSDRSRLAALATLHALAGCLPSAVGLDLLEIRAVPVGGCTAALCALSAAGGRSVLGVCQVEEDELGAAARAVLDAVNRLRRRSAGPRRG